MSWMENHWLLNDPESHCLEEVGVRHRKPIDTVWNILGIANVIGDVACGHVGIER